MAAMRVTSETSATPPASIAIPIQNNNPVPTNNITPPLANPADMKEAAPTSTIIPTTTAPAVAPANNPIGNPVIVPSVVPIETCRIQAPLLLLPHKVIQVVPKNLIP